MNERYIWSNSENTIALMTEEQFKKMSKGYNLKECNLGDLLITADKEYVVVYGKEIITYDYRQFTEAMKLAKILDKFFVIVVPDKEFPLAFKCRAYNHELYEDEQPSLYVLVAPFVVPDEIKKMFGDSYDNNNMSKTRYKD